MQQSFPKALIVEGGAMRGIFTTGVLDGFLANKFNPFDLFFGVSSGAGNIAAYLAEMPKRNFRIYTDFSIRPEFISLKRFFRGGHLMDLDWLWDKTIAEIRLDLKTILSNRKPFIVCLTDVETGKAIYKKTDEKNLEAVLKASSAIPILYQTFPLIDGRQAVDGGIADPLPVAETLRWRARKIMVIRSRPRGYKKKGSLSHALMLWKLKRFPSLKEAVADHVRRYNDAVSLIREPPRGISITEICPPDNFRQTRLGRNLEILMEGYQQGRRLADEAIRSWDSHEG